MSAPAIDYTDKDYASLRSAMLRLASQRLPEWTDRSPSDLVMVLIDLFAYCGDILAYYQDRIASELFPETATETAGLVDLLRLIGYELSPVTPARTDLQLTFARPIKPADPRNVTIPRGCQFRAEVPDYGPVEFVYLGDDLSIDLTSDQVRPDPDPAAAVLHYDVLPVEQGVQKSLAALGSGTGEPNQTFALPDPHVTLDSVVIEVRDGTDWVRWYRASDSTPSTDQLAREYRLSVDPAGLPRLVFADRPLPVAENNVRASYRVCLGARGNVAAGAISEARTAITALVAVTNGVAAAGGSDMESAQSAVSQAPRVFRSQQRAVTTADYVALTRRTGAVAKVRVSNRSYNRVDLYVAPAGDTVAPLSESLRNYLLAYFEDKRPLGTTVQILGARGAPIDIGCAIVLDQRFAASTVVGNVRAAITQLLTFSQVDFAQTLYVSDVYAVVESVAGVIGVTVDRFRRSDNPRAEVDAELARSGLPPLAQLPDFLRAAVSGEVEPTGRIDVGEFEIPVLDALDVRTTTT